MKTLFEKQQERKSRAALVTLWRKFVIFVIVQITRWLFLVLALPFYFCWNYIAPKYFTFLPAIWLQIPLIDCVALFTLLWIFRVVIPKPFQINTEVKQ